MANTASKQYRPPADPQKLYAAISPTVLSAGYHPAATGFRYRPLKPRVAEFYFWYIAGGAGSICLDGQWTSFSRGDFLVLKPGQRYQEETADVEDPSRVYFSYMMPFDRTSAKLTRELAAWLPTRIACPTPARAESLFAELLETFTVVTDRRPLRLRILAMEILDLVFASVGAAGIDLTARQRSIVRQASEFIEQNLLRSISPEDVAEHAGVSASHLFALFRRQVGCSPIRYQTELRLRAASRMLIEGRSVTDAARETGFTSLHYFSRLFRKRLGMSPSVFARRIRSK
jgi:AraC-like DNA-binding protein